MHVSWKQSSASAGRRGHQKRWTSPRGESSSAWKGGRLTPRVGNVGARACEIAGAGAHAWMNTGAPSGTVSSIQRASCGSVRMQPRLTACRCP